MIKGPGIFLAQFLGDEPPFNTFDSICKWASDLGYKGVQIPGWDGRCIDLKLAAESKGYCDDIAAVPAKYGMEITEIATHLLGQLVAVHPAYDEQFDGFAPEAQRGNPQARTEWAVQQVKYALKASQNLGLKALPSFSGALLWHTMYPWPQRPVGLVEEGFAELAKRWKPILDVADECGIDIAWEVHPGEDIHGGATYELMLDAVNNHPRACLLYDPSHFVLQCLDYLQYIDIYHERIKAFHVKDAEFNPSGRVGVYGGYQGWQERAGRFRSLGDGQVDFVGIFSKLTQYGFDGWAVLEWECCLKDAAQGAEEGAPFISSMLITPPSKAFDDFAGGSIDKNQLRRILGLQA